MRNSKRDLVDEGWNLVLLSPRLCPAEGPTSADPAQNLASFIPVRSIIILLLCDKPEILASPNSRMQFPTTDYVLQIPPHFLSERHVCLSICTTTFIEWILLVTPQEGSMPVGLPASGIVPSPIRLPHYCQAFSFKT